MSQIDVVSPHAGQSNTQRRESASIEVASDAGSQERMRSRRLIVMTARVPRPGTFPARFPEPACAGHRRFRIFGCEGQA